MLQADEPITPAFLETGSWDIEIADRRYPMVASLRPLYDAENHRIKM